MRRTYFVGKPIRQSLYTSKNVLDNNLQYVLGGTFHCMLMRVMYENFYQYDPDHEGGGLPWICNTVVQIVLQHSVSQRVITAHLTRTRAIPTIKILG